MSLASVQCGAFHGSAHSQKWIADTAAELHAEQLEERLESQARERLALERAAAEERRAFGEQLELL